MAAVIEIPGYSEFERVGAGASGIVYRAHQLAFGDRVVAVKVIPDSDVDDTTARRFQRECLGAGKLSWHPNVVSVYDAGVTDDGLAYLVMEYLEAGSLADRLRSKGAIPWHQAVDMTIKVAGALAAAHGAGLVHRDVKPENILVGPFGEPKLGDFGIAFIEGRSRSRTGSISGTIAHSAPEALAGKPTESSDLYALGSTLYALLTGTPPFVRPDDHSITPLITRIATADVPDLRPRGVPDSLAGVIERAMAKEPSDRWPDAGGFGAALQEVQRLEGQAVTPLLVESTAARPAPLAASTPPPPRPVDEEATVLLAPDYPAPLEDPTADSQPDPIVDPEATLLLDRSPAVTVEPPSTDSASAAPVQDKRARNRAEDGAQGRGDEGGLPSVSRPLPMWPGPPLPSFRRSMQVRPLPEEHKGSREQPTEASRLERGGSLPRWPGPPMPSPHRQMQKLRGPSVTPATTGPNSKGPGDTIGRSGTHADWRPRSGAMLVGAIALIMGLLIGVVALTRSDFGPFHRDTRSSPTVSVGVPERNGFATIEGQGFPGGQPVVLQHCGVTDDDDTFDCQSPPRHVTPSFDGEIATTVFVGPCLAGPDRRDVITAQTTGFASFPVDERISFRCR